jgi:hypothetical protein
MRSSNEMYERGIFDAEQDELNLFYYQHYYYYRKGYDKARKRVYRASRALPFSRSLLLVAAASIVVILLAAVGLHVYQDSSAPSDRTASSAAVATTSTPRPTRTPALVLTATATLTPTEVIQPVLRPGGQARVVNVGAAALLARSGPGTNEPVQARFIEGTDVTILEGPVEADGYTWWLIEAAGRNGWSADSSPEGVVWLEPL